MSKTVRYMAVILMVLALAGPAAARVHEAWVARYDGPAGGRDVARAIALDDAGNVYVTGSSTGLGTGVDYATVKYDTDGNELWVARYNGPADGDDISYALALDAAGNVHVTGKSQGIGTGEDYATVKYDPDGNELWVARYNGPADSNDVAWAIMLDPAGNVYVTGSSAGLGTGVDYATVKYDTDGNEQWVARFDGPVSGSDVARAIALDAAGNVYVAGQSTLHRYDFTTAKYAPDGSEQWVARYDGPGNQNDIAMSVAIDDNGYAYVAGYSEGNGTGFDYAVVKYDTDGNEQWVARYDGPARSHDLTHIVALDAAGNAYVTGYSRGIGTDDDYATVKYDPDGNEQWVARYDGPAGGRDRAHTLTLDAAGNVYVTGSSVGIGTGNDITTVKYDTDGSEQWVMRYNGPADSNDFGHGIAVDQAGNVYVIGFSYDDASDFDYVTIKYSPEVGVNDRQHPAPGARFSVAPNPLLDGRATLRYSPSGAGPVRVTVYDVAGRSVFSTREPGHQATGSLSLDLRSLSPGVYLVRLEAGSAAGADGYLQKLVIR